MSRLPIHFVTRKNKTNMFFSLFSDGVEKIDEYNVGILLPTRVRILQVQNLSKRNKFLF
jgi:hypothetical protein